MPMHSAPAALTEQRRSWMGVLARAKLADMEAACSELTSLPSFEWLRRPETGLVMVRARVGGTGAKFNFGEMSVTRCALRIPSGEIGYAYVKGRDARHAELAAVVDAMMQDASLRDTLQHAVIDPLHRLQTGQRALRERQAAATRVEFYTVARGD